MLLNIVIFCSFLGNTAPLAFASTKQYGITRQTQAQPVYPLYGGHQVNGQHYSEASEIGNTAVFQGRNQGNSGNMGFNAGSEQNNGENHGNQISSQHRGIAVQKNYQTLHKNGSNGNGDTAIFRGINQGNSGNQGVNRGNVQDSANNTGNQVNNQGNVIGTQVNALGTSVNNQGNTIYHQTNNISILPDVGVSFTLRPDPQLSLNVGRR